jgi:transcriptional regulator with GAF, ATPase, and Fis domain
MDRAAILGDGKTPEVLTALGVPPSSAITGTCARAESAGGCRTPVGEDEEIVTLERAMARHIERALRCTGGQIEGADGAARLLDINPPALRARIRKLGIDWQQFRQ